MSFSSKVKEELCSHIGGGRHCQIAEISAMFYFCGQISQKNSKNPEIFLTYENPRIALKSFTLLKKVFNIYEDADFDDCVIKEGSSFKLVISEKVESIYDAISSKKVTMQSCCRRAFIRGAFLSSGSVSDPSKSYHLEIVSREKNTADRIVEELKTFDVEAKIALRGHYYVAYVKEAASIVTCLNVMEASVALMDMENAIIYKDMRNSINRRNNCDAANIKKTANAYVSQAKDIEKLMKADVFKTLPEGLKELAKVRLDNPDATLKELGELLDPPIGKSGVNHRLRKLKEISEGIPEF